MQARQTDDRERIKIKCYYLLTHRTTFIFLTLFRTELIDNSKTQEEENKNRNTMDADNNQPPPSVDLGNGTQQYPNGTLITMEFRYREGDDDWNDHGNKRRYYY